jgi:4-hydroxyphenylpyruvate dioxygenase
MRHPRRAIDLYQQHDITMLLNRGPGFARGSPPPTARASARWAGGQRRGRRGRHRGRPAAPDRPTAICAARRSPACRRCSASATALLYFVDGHRHRRGAGLRVGLRRHPDRWWSPTRASSTIDHLTNNVAKGELPRWAGFYKDVFGFTEVRYFDIRGVQTGLTSYALRSPDGRFCIPINEGTEAKSQINEYLEEYNGPGVQHLAFLTDDILGSLRPRSRAAASSSSTSTPTTTRRCSTACPA